MLEALVAALLFGASAPISKLMLGKVEPILLAALLYMGCGLGAIILLFFRKVLEPSITVEAKLKKNDLPWIAGAVIAGGILAPIVLLFSLRATPASTASLLLNGESVATAVIAAIVFREAIGKPIWWAVALITAGSIFLSLDLTGKWGFSPGALGVLAACFLWGLDNNFTRNVSDKDPLAIVTIKGLVAGSFSLLLGLVLGNLFPPAKIALLAILVGSLCYGVSIALFVHALRSLGAARTGALYATAPFLGALLSFILLREGLSVLFFIALPLMIIGAVLLLGEDHQHSHIHDHLEHEHCHTHPDIHHTHNHDLDYQEETTTHSHWHTHRQLVHVHAHTPDLHHRHDH
jgi:drug/metabolite transporter (DMT)-like permease